MYIRQTRTASKATGEAYITYRLVRSERIGGRVRQITMLNLGRHFSVPTEDWPALCARIEQLTGGQASLMDVELPPFLEKMAQGYAGRLVTQVPKTVPAPVPTEPTYAEVDVDSLELSQPRSVGVEHVGLHAAVELGLEEKLTELGVNGVMRASILGLVIGRMAKPASELATWGWLREHSALGELIDTDFNAMPLMRLYRASDELLKHRAEIEQHVFERARCLFHLEETITLYDLTNTYFEGDCTASKAARGRSKEKRSDCPLVTLGLVLDGSGFVRSSRVFEGNAVESCTLQSMLLGLNAPTHALVIMDAGIATEANIAWLSEHGYRYLVVSRERHRHFDAEHAVAIENQQGQSLRLQKVLSDDGREVRMYCHSEQREQKEAAILTRLCSRFEGGLQKLADGLIKPRGEKRLDKITERIGRLKEKCQGIGQHYQVDVQADASGKQVASLTWARLPVSGSMATHPGVYCLRSNETTWEEEKLWRTYTMLTDLEAVFRSLKSELGLRPVYHTKEDRIDGHLFITVLAYQLVHVLRVKLHHAGIQASWNTLRDILSVQRRVTATFQQRDGRTLHVRKSTRAEPELLRIYQVLGIEPAPGGTKKLIH